MRDISGIIWVRREAFPSSSTLILLRTDYGVVLSYLVQYQPTVGSSRNAFYWAFRDNDNGTEHETTLHCHVNALVSSQSNVQSLRSVPVPNHWNISAMIHENAIPVHNVVLMAVEEDVFQPQVHQVYSEFSESHRECLDFQWLGKSNQLFALFRCPALETWDKM